MATIDATAPTSARTTGGAPHALIATTARCGYPHIAAVTEPLVQGYVRNGTGVAVSRSSNSEDWAWHLIGVPLLVVLLLIIVVAIAG